MIENNFPEPKLISHFPSKSYGYDKNLYLNMFRDDLSQGVLPIGGKSKKDFKVEFEGDEKTQNYVIELLNSFNNYHDDELIESVCDSVEVMATELAYFGQSLFEIIQNNDDPSLYYLHGITSVNLYKIPFYYFQIIPKADLIHYKKRIAITKSKNIWKVNFPNLLGGKNKYLKIHKKIQRFDIFGPKFFQEDLKNRSISKNFDSMNYRKLVETFLSAETSILGWNRRDYSQRNSTEFFLVYRTLKFKWTKAILREHIISELNNLFCRLNLNAKIIVTGLPSPADIINVRQKLTDGKINFEEALDIIEY